MGRHMQARDEVAATLLSTGADASSSGVTSPPILGVTSAGTASTATSAPLDGAALSELDIQLTAQTEQVWLDKAAKTAKADATAAAAAAAAAERAKTPTKRQRAAASKTKSAAPSTTTPGAPLPAIESIVDSVEAAIPLPTVPAPTAIYKLHVPYVLKSTAELDELPEAERWAQLEEDQLFLEELAVDAAMDAYQKVGNTCRHIVSS